MEFWHDSLIANKIVEAALQIRKKARHIRDTGDSMGLFEEYKHLEGKLLDIALRIQEAHEIQE